MGWRWDRAWATARAGDESVDDEVSHLRRSRQGCTPKKDSPSDAFCWIGISAGRAFESPSSTAWQAWLAGPSAERWQELMMNPRIRLHTIYSPSSRVSRDRRGFVIAASACRSPRLHPNLGTSATKLVVDRRDAGPHGRPRPTLPSSPVITHSPPCAPTAHPIFFPAVPRAQTL